MEAGACLFIVARLTMTVAAFLVGRFASTKPPGNLFSAQVPPVVPCALTAGLAEESMDSLASGRRGARGDGSQQADPRDPWLQGGPPVVLCDVAAGFREG